MCFTVIYKLSIVVFIEMSASVKSCTSGMMEMLKEQTVSGSFQVVAVWRVQMSEGLGDCYRFWCDIWLVSTECPDK